MDIPLFAPSADANKALLMTQYKNSANINKIISIFAEAYDLLESVSISVGDCLSLATSTGDQLDLVGGCFAVNRESRTDDAYRAAIYAEIAINGSGTTEDIIRACKVVFGATGIEVVPEYPGKFFVQLETATNSVANVNKFLEIVAPAGVLAMHGNYLVDAHDTLIVTALGDNILAVVQDGTRP